MRPAATFALAATLLAASSPSRAQAPEQAKAPEQAATLSDAQKPELELDIGPEGEIHVGDPIRVRLSAVAPAGTRVRVPDQDLAPFELLERQAKPTERLPDGRERHVFELTLMRFEPGEVTFPALEVRVVTPDETVATLRTEPRSLQVGSRVANEPNAEPRARTAPVTVMEEDYTLAWVAGGLLAALALAALGYWYARYRARQPKPAPPPAPADPPWEVALARLAELEAERERWLREERAAEYVDAVSDIVRAYLGDRYGFDGLESTTDEVVAALSAMRHPELPMTDVVTLLSDCDLVKFAKATPDAEMCNDVHAQARRMVERSRPAPDAGSGGDEAHREVQP